MIIEWLITYWFIVVPSIISCIITFLITHYYHLKNKKEKLPKLFVRNINIIKNLVGKVTPLEISYSGEKIQNLSVAKVFFQNAGTESIEKSDIRPKNPIRIGVKKGYKILDADIIKGKYPDNDYSITTKSNYIELKFDHIDKNEGVIIQFFHTGASYKDLKIGGKIKGFGQLKGKRLRRFTESKRTETILGSIILIVIGIISFVILPKGVSPANILSLGMMILLIIIGINRLRFIKRIIPKEFDIFYEDFQSI